MTTVLIDHQWRLHGRLGLIASNRVSRLTPVTVPGSPKGPMREQDANPDIAALLQRVVNGDPAAFSRVYDLTSGMVYGLVLRVIRSPEMADEVTQEVYLQIWEQAEAFDPERGSARSWIATLAHRRAVDAVRRSQSSRDREEKALPEVPQDDVADSAMEADEHSRVRAALASLTPLQYEAIEMAYYGGMTYREVAERLDTPLGTVKSRMRDGLMKLREVFGNDHV